MERAKSSTNVKNSINSTMNNSNAIDSNIKNDKEQIMRRATRTPSQISIKREKNGIFRQVVNQRNPDISFNIDKFSSSMFSHKNDTHKRRSNIQQLASRTNQSSPNIPYNKIELDSVFSIGES